MSTRLSDPQFRLFAICSVILSAQMLLLGGYTAARRAGNKNYLNPEDNKVSFKDARLVEGAEHPEVARIQRAHRNLLERLPMFLGLGLICLLAGASPLGVEEQSHAAGRFESGEGPLPLRWSFSGPVGGSAAGALLAF